MRRAQEDSTPNKGGASKRKLKKDRRAKRQELADEAQSECVTWDEDQASATAPRGGSRQAWVAEVPGSGLG